LTGNIQKPTGKKDSEVNIRGKYEVRWEGVKNLKFVFIEIK
jgi:hypothetical protein